MAFFHPVPCAVHLRHPGVRGKSLAMPQQEIPVEQVERAGLLARLLLHPVVATAAVIRHPVDIGPGTDIGLRPHHAAIGELAHADRVRRLDPFEGIDIDRQIPFMHMGRVHPREQREIPRHHQPLDVMGIGHVPRLPHRMAHAGHPRLAPPIDRRQGAGMPQRVAPHVIGALQRPDAAHEFPPADDLPDEPLCRIDRHAPRLPFRLDPAADLHGRQKAKVQIGRDQRMAQRRIARQHRILLIPEGGQRMGREMLQRRQRIRPRHAPAEGPERPKMRRKPRLDQRQHLLRHRIRRETRRARAEEIGLGRLAVVMVEIPLPARRLVPLHHQPGLAPHLAIEEFHPQLLAPLGPGAELRLRTEEPVIRQHGHRQRAVLQRGAQPPIPRRGGDHLARAHLRRAPDQFPHDALAVLRIIQPGIGDLPAARAQLFREMPHRRQDQRDLLRVMRDVGSFRHHLGHHHHITRMRGAQRGHVGRQLIAQHKDQTRPAHAPLPQAARPADRVRSGIWAKMKPMPQDRITTGSPPLSSRRTAPIVPGRSR